MFDIRSSLIWDTFIRNKARTILRLQVEEEQARQGAQQDSDPHS
jgi:hypothetical protein